MTKTIPETVAITTIRAGLFFSCRKFLLRSLYSDLQDWSSGASLPSDSSTTPGSAGDFDLPVLPTPVSGGGPKSKGALLVRQSSLHSTISRLVFAECFAESCVMFLLLMFQALDVLEPSSRLLNWRISLYILMSMILLFVPLGVSLSLTAASLSPSRTDIRTLGPKFLLSLIPVSIYLFLISYVPLPSSLSISTFDFSTAALARLIVLGTIVLGLLSGFGAINNSWAFLPQAWQSDAGKAVPSDQDINVAEHALARVRNDLAQKKADVQRQAKSSGSWFSRMIGSGQGDLQELAGLEALEYQMSLSLEAQRLARANARFSSTLTGKIFNFGGRIFAAYCAVRIISSTIHILAPSTSNNSARNSSADLITDALAYLVSVLSSAEIDREHVATISRHISLLLVGVIILTSVRYVLRGFTRILRVTSRNLGASLMLLFLAQLMGIYLLSTVVQLRTSFPPSPSPSPPNNSEESGSEVEGSTNLFSTIPPYESFGSLFDWSFLLSALGTVVFRWGVEKVSGAGM